MPVNWATLKVPQRWVVCALCSLSLAFTTVKNTSLVIFFDMIKSATERTKNSSGGCPFVYSETVWYKSEVPSIIPELYWNSKLLDMGDPAFYIGRMVMVIPAGVLADIGYSKYVLCGGMLLMTLGYLELSVLAKLGVTMYVVENLIQGIAQAMIYSSVFSLIARWARPTERTLFTALVFAGIDYGDALGYFLFYLINFKFKSWNSGCFILGTVGLLWLGLGSIFIHHSPKYGPSSFRSDYSMTRSSRPIRRRTYMQKIYQLLNIPWRKIFTSPPFLSLILAYCAVFWAVYVNIWGSLPKYQKYILHLPARFSERSNIMFVSTVPSSLIAGWFADWVINHNVMSKTLFKKTFVLTCLLLASVLQVTIVFVGCNIMLFWVLSITVAYVLGATFSVICSTPVDLSIRHAGLLMGVITSARTVFGILREKLDDTLIIDHYNLVQWRILFLSYSALALIMLIPFLFFGSAEEQNWRNTRPTNIQQDERSATALRSTTRR